MGYPQVYPQGLFVPVDNCELHSCTHGVDEVIVGYQTRIITGTPGIIGVDTPSWCRHPKYLRVSTLFPLRFQGKSNVVDSVDTVDTCF